MRMIMVAVLAALALPAVASARTTQSSTPEPTKSKPAKAKEICRVVKVTGQRVPRRECRTEAEWANIDAARDRMEGVRLRVDRPQGN